MFITFEGLDFSGKSTQANMLFDYLNKSGYKVKFFREPGGTPISEHIRNILLDKKVLGMSDISELLLFSAARAQLIKESIKPLLVEGYIVLLDRFYDSTTAYQGFGRGIDVEKINSINRIASNGLVPDITFFVDISIEEMIRRRVHKESLDRMESSSREFYEKTRQGYLWIAGREQRFKVIDGSKPINDIFDIVRNHVESRILHIAQGSAIEKKY